MSAGNPSAGKSSWERLIAAYDRNAFSSLELRSNLYDHIRQAPADYEAIVAALRQHPEEFVQRTVADDLVRFVTDWRKVIDYDTEAAPLDDRIGCRVEIYGGYTAAYQPIQDWLGGRQFLGGALYGPLKVAQNRLPVAAIKLDTVLEVVQGAFKLRGDFLALAPRYVGHTWAAASGVAYAYLMEKLPRDYQWWSTRESLEIESHASYRFLD